jgi:hypothetical protein
MRIRSGVSFPGSGLKPLLHRETILAPLRESPQLPGLSQARGAAILPARPDRTEAT